MKYRSEFLMKILIYVLILFPVYVYGQEIEGYIYDDKGRVSGVAVKNRARNITEVSNENGYFKIEAAIGDSLHFNSVAYEFYELIIEENHFRRKIVVELNISSLDEITINSYRTRNTSIEELDDELADQIQKDIKKHPNYYRPSKGNIGNLIQSIFDLFKKDTEPKTAELKFLKFEDFEILFRRDDFFDSEFLTEQLQIPKESRELFYEYLDSKLMNSSFLEDSNRLDLIDKLYTYSQEYLEIIKTEEHDNE